jgi:hypothetical protein
MVEHIVLFKFKPDATAEQRRAVVEGLQGMRETVPGIVDLSCGENFSERSQGYQIGLVVRFRDRQGLETYLPHPNHRSVVEERVRPIVESVIVVDYEF